MCGICGVMSHMVSLNELDHFYDLSAMATHRGRWGGGVVCVQSNKKNMAIRVARSVQPLNALVASERFHDTIGKERNFVLGHARWPTQGGAEIKNVHPHCVGDIIGVHNGTMGRVAGQTVGKDESDSALVFKAINDVGVKEFIKESTGAFALVWLNQKEKTINFLRNNQRPLWFAETGWNQKVSTVHFASEREQLDIVLRRHYKTMLDTRFTMLPELKHYIYPMRVRHDIRPEEVINYAPPPVEVRPYSGYFHGAQDWDDHPAAVTRPLVGAEPGRNVLRLPDHTKANLLPGPSANIPLNASELAKRALALLNMDKAKEEAKSAKKILNTSICATKVHENNKAVCCWCNAKAIEGDTLWPIGSVTGQRSDFICDECVDIPDVLEFLEPNYGNETLGSIN